VRVAAALVAGQAVLCAVIGYVTLGGDGFRGREAAPIGDPLAAAPFVVPTPRVRSPSATTVAPKPPAGARSTTLPVAAVPSRQHPEPTPAPPAGPTAPEPPPDVLVATSGPSTDATTSTSIAPTPAATSADDSGGQPAPSPPASVPTEQGVTIGDPCGPVDAPGVTGDGTAALCRPDNAGILRWQQT
jgi:hypothetical protein